MTVDSIKAEAIRGVILQPGWYLCDALSKETRRFKIAAKEAVQLHNLGCTSQDISEVLAELGATSLNSGQIEANDSIVSTHFIDVEISDYNRFIRPNIPNIDQYEPVPLPDSYEEVTKGQIAKARDLLFQPNKWVDSTKPSHLTDEPPVKQKSISFSQTELTERGVNALVFSYVLRKQMQVSTHPGIGSRDDIIKITVDATDFNVHIAPHIRTTKVD